MSIAMTTYIWKHSRQRGSLKLLLLAIADCANDDGWAWPGAPELAEMLGVLERQVRKIVTDAEASGELVVFNRVKEVGSERHYSNVYYLPSPTSNPAAMPDLPGVTQVTTLSSVTWSQCLAGQGVVSSETPSTVSSTTGGGVAQDRGRVSSATPDPLNDPLPDPINDSVNDPYARARASPPDEKALDIWKGVYFQLKAQLDAGSFDTALRDAALLAVERPSPQTEVWLIGVRSVFARDYCAGRLGRMVERVLRSCNGFRFALGADDLRIEYVVAEKEQSN